MTSYHIDLDHLTVIATDKAGEDYDLNATGEPCTDIADLRSYIRELRDTGCISPEDAIDLYWQISG